MEKGRRELRGGKKVGTKGMRKGDGKMCKKGGRKIGWEKGGWEKRWVRKVDERE